jgi:hypothetical protein
MLADATPNGARDVANVVHGCTRMHLFVALCDAELPITLLNAPRILRCSTSPPSLTIMYVDCARKAVEIPFNTLLGSQMRSLMYRTRLDGAPSIDYDALTGCPRLPWGVDRAAAAVLLLALNVVRHLRVGRSGGRIVGSCSRALTFVDDCHMVSMSVRPAVYRRGSKWRTCHWCVKIRCDIGSRT